MVQSDLDHVSRRPCQFRLPLQLLNGIWTPVVGHVLFLDIREQHDWDIRGKQDLRPGMPALQDGLKMFVFVSKR